jgi:SNF2 family DNA or RNA helicase
MSEPIAYPFRVPPFPYQAAEFEASRQTRAHAILWEQGLGKSKVTIDTGCWQYGRGLIDAAVVVAPNGVHRNWVEEELIAHVPEIVMPHVRALAYSSEASTTKWQQKAIRDLINHPGFIWFAISYEAFTTNAGKRALIEIFDRRRVLYILDEAHYIKNPDADRTKSILKSAQYAEFRRILTGTPIAIGPFDMYSEIAFLDPHFWEKQGFSTYTEFKKHFGEFKKVWNPTAWNPKTKARTGAEVDVLVAYRRSDQLHKMIQPIVSRLTKEDAGLNLPSKHYTKIRFEMTPEQALVYDQMREEFVVWIDEILGNPSAVEDGVPMQYAAQGLFCPSCSGTGEINDGGYIYRCPECSEEGEGVGEDHSGRAVVANMAIVRLLRLQQIACGYLPTGDEEEPTFTIPGENRRLNALCDAIQERLPRHKVIVWARFQMDITLILEELKRRGVRAVRYDGLVSEKERADAKARFKGERPRFENGQVVGREVLPPEEQADVFVGNPAAGATGLTMNIAKSTFYYSNSFKLIDRLQSEDRNHRIGQDGALIPGREDLGPAVEYVDFVAEGTVDEKIVDSFRKKLSIAGQILGDRMRTWI